MEAILKTIVKPEEITKKRVDAERLSKYSRRLPDTSAESFPGRNVRCLHLIGKDTCQAAGIKPGTYQETETLREHYNCLHAARCTYDRGGMPTTVHHYFLRLGL